jgi:FKBP-type peptidyl-prolyl cis-trans isomerase FkpA
VIRGWQLGIPEFKTGGFGKLIIPSSLAYGPSGSGSIPPNAVLVFDVELIEIVT